jgi:putative flippase GtrA
VGAAGFLVDAGVLQLAMFLATGLYLGRLVSYLAAATFTWFLNRHYTFAATRSNARGGEWSRFLAANAIGGLVNYSVYAAMVAGFSRIAALPALGVAAGSIAGLVINFTLSKRLVFRGPVARR